jgi:hypothetical protein
VPVSISGGGNAIGYAGTFSATATNVGGGYASAYANEGIDTPDAYNNITEGRVLAVTPPPLSNTRSGS